MTQTTNFDFKALPEQQQVAFYGTVFAMAAADDELVSEELTLIFETLDLDGLSPEAQRQVRAYTLDPPALDDCLGQIKDGSPMLRYGIMVYLMDVALADDIIVDEERAVLEQAAGVLEVSEQQLRAIERFTREVRRIRSEGLSENAAAEAMKGALSGLTGVGIPIAAVYFSGSVLGFSAAGITSGLAALGLGFGMLTGIGVVIAVGTATFISVRWLLNRSKAHKKNEIKTNNDRRAQLVVKNLQATINDLADRIIELKEKADTADANEKAITVLANRMKALQKLLARRQAHGPAGATA